MKWRVKICRENFFLICERVFKTKIFQKEKLLHKDSKYARFYEKLVKKKTNFPPGKIFNFYPNFLKQKFSLRGNL